ncbi:hypothetical protein CIN_21680 [Commensalibacter intestini A911]|uniref:Cyanophage baseplate Pam3 plug gp18 domain-containing protein n=1 Tax=Commensalibacter intestini A911 TaxID=1088868 RepID=G6F3H2_9PROT|nr:hypothetical protein [Commensalibacter intestini]EHD12922.1 hypothetical protein CIN_21680 [Commensalibacter intestini A911]
MADSRYAFTPSENNNPPFQITVTLDGGNYIFKTWYNIYSRRWFFTLSDLNQNVIRNAPLISSTEALDINLVFNLFSQNTLIYRDDLGFIYVKDVSSS